LHQPKACTLCRRYWNSPWKTGDVV